MTECVTEGSIYIYTKNHEGKGRKRKAQANKIKKIIRKFIKRKGGGRKEKGRGKNLNGSRISIKVERYYSKDEGERRTAK